MKPSVVVRPNPVLFRLPKSVVDETKENPSTLSYRSIFAVLTLDSVLIYDTHHDQPLAVARGLHYAGLTDCCWSQDGLHLMVSSTDGYISILSFEDGELGEVYSPPVEQLLVADTTPCTLADIENVRGDVVDAPKPTPVVQPDELPKIAPCEPGQSAILEAPPAKRAKTRITPTLLSACEKPASNQVTPAKRNLAVETDQVGDAVNKLSLGAAASASRISEEAQSAEDVKPVKKKKRIQPVLLSN